ncbi:MAG: C69 family dipeptidase [Bacteroidaceae bacterium]|nr:C69 family dipeptidase [Bacteroidaceae bacterium]
MKRYFLIASLFLLIFQLSTFKSFSCTNLIVGKAASADGSVIVSYNADSYGMYGHLYRHVGGKHVPGEMRKIYEWDTNKYLGEIPQAPVTYNVVGQMNEHQVSICETTFGGREELVDTTGIIDYGSLIYIGLERATTAREAIKIMTDLVAKYGYCSEGETFTVADKNEAWILEMVGKGPGRTGAVWVAVRIPDDCICAHANQSRITRFDMKDKQNVMFAKDMVKFAREKGFFTGKKDADFSFRDAFNPLDFGGIRYCDARAWVFFNKHVDGMDKYLPYINGEDMTLEMPLYMKPKHLLSVQDVQNGMRDHYEGTPLDMQQDLGSGPYNMPYRPSPLSFTVDGKKYYTERPTSTQQTGFSFVGQMRSAYPDPIGGVIWWTNDDANMTAYTPIYCGVSKVPQCYERIAGEQDELTFSWNSAFWLCNTVSNIVYPYYSKMYPDLQAAQQELETAFQKEQLRVDTEARSLYDESADKAIEYLTAYSNGAADRMMDRWDILFKYLVVKHNDMVVKAEENGHFKRTKHGFGAAPIRPSYPERYWREVVKQTGERYLMK